MIAVTISIFIWVVALAPLAGYTALELVRRRRLDLVGIWVASTLVVGFLSVTGPDWLPTTPFVLFLLISAPFLLRRIRAAGIPLVSALAALAGIIFATSALWSPEPRRALGLALTALSAAVATAGISTEIRRDRRVGDLAMASLAPVVILQAVSIVVFRFAPGLEWHFLASGAGSAFLGEELASLMTESATVNVTDPDKAGGLLFLNANRASMVMAVCSLVYLAWSSLRRRPVFCIPAGVSLIAVPLSGSKTPFLLVMIVGAGCVLGWMLFRRVRTRIIVAVALSSAVAATAGALLLIQFFPRVLASMQESTIQPRQAMWGEAWKMILDSPVTGLGAGGWEERWGAVAGDYNLAGGFQPHNFVLYGATQVGVIGAVVLGAVGLVAALVALARTKFAQDAPTAVATLLAGSAWGWMWLHGLADNTAFYGSENVVPLLSVALAVTLCAGTDSEVPKFAAPIRLSTPRVKSQGERE